MNLLITGGAGFIGTNFVYYILNNTNHNIIIVDSLTYASNINNLKNAFDTHRCIFYQTNICDKESIEKIFNIEKPDIVINFAAESHVDNSIKNPKIFLETNIIGTSTLMDCCVKFNTRYHQISTDEVYGDLPLDRPDLKFDENYPLKTSSPYSTSKASADLLVMSYYRTYNLPVSISRCSNNYGPYQHKEKLIPKTIFNLMNDNHIGVYGNGLNVRDWLYVEDHCAAIYEIISSNKSIGQIFNIGGNNEKTNIEIVKLLLKEFNKDETYIDFIEDRKGHDLRYAINADKMYNTFGWKPKYTFDLGIQKTVDWYKYNNQL